eukprot:UN28525
MKTIKIFVSPTCMKFLNDSLQLLKLVCPMYEISVDDELLSESVVQGIDHNFMWNIFQEVHMNRHSIESKYKFDDLPKQIQDYLLTKKNNDKTNDHDKVGSAETDVHTYNNNVNNDNDVITTTKKTKRKNINY